MMAACFNCHNKPALCCCFFIPKTTPPAALGVAVCGVSRDSVKTHQNFAAKLALPFPLLSDRDEVVCQAFTVIKQKQMYGKTVRGIERSTFLITPQGEIIQAWRGVKAVGHAQTVLTALQAHFAAI
jgi:peroxiredoxin Q/BCP